MRKTVNIQGHAFLVTQPFRGSESARLKDPRWGREIVQFYELEDDRRLMPDEIVDFVHYQTGEDRGHIENTVIDGDWVQYGALLGLQGNEKWPWRLVDLEQYFDEEE